MKFYIAKGDQKYGPFAINELAANGLTRESLVWTEGYPQWKRASEVPELAEILQGIPPEFVNDTQRKPDELHIMPKTWLTESILVTLCCCLPFGIVGIIYASKVEGLYIAKQYEAANYQSSQAKKWVTLGFIFGLIGGIIYLIYYMSALGSVLLK